MAHRVVLIENDAILKCKLDHLLAVIDNEEIWIPLSDISTIVVDNLKTTVTTRTLNAFSKENICMVMCDEKHLPCGLFLSHNQHSRSAKIIKYQLNFSDDLYSELWKKIIYAKIFNQIQVMERLSHVDEVAKLYDYIENIQPGDPSNREAHAAKVYFNTIMGTSHSRGNKDLLINSGLDYGYAIIRSYLARLCCGHGLETAISVHHCSEYNAFNLVDDLIEPMRPIVDYYAKEILDDDKIFGPSHRTNLVNILNHKILFCNKEMYLSNALEKYVQSFVDVIKHGDLNKIQIPEFKNYIGIEQ